MSFFFATRFSPSFTNISAFLWSFPSDILFFGDAFSLRVFFVWIRALHLQSPSLFFPSNVIPLFFRVVPFLCRGNHPPPNGQFFQDVTVDVLTFFFSGHSPFPTPPFSVAIFSLVFLEKPFFFLTSSYDF